MPAVRVRSPLRRCWHGRDTEAMAELALDRQENEPPWEGHCQELLRSQSQEGIVFLLEPKVREEGWGALPHFGP